MRAFAVVTAVAAVILVGPGVTHAGTYVVEACRTAHGGPAAVDSWVVSPIPADAPADDLVSDTCRFGNHLWFNVAGQSGEIQGLRWSFRPPAGTTVAAVSLTRDARVFAGQEGMYRLLAEDQVLDQSPAEPEWRVVGDFTAAQLRASGLDLEFTCGDDGCSGDARFLTVEQATVTIRDEVPPQVVGVPSGRLTSGRTQDGIIDLKLGFKDVGGGVQAIDFKVDGLTRFTERVGGLNCELPYVVVTPCASEGYATLMLDTDELSDGPHSVEAVLVDVAGNRTSIGPYGISVRTPPPSAPPGVEGTPANAPDLVIARPSVLPRGDGRSSVPARVGLRMRR